MKQIFTKFFGAFLIIILALSGLILYFTFSSIDDNYLQFINNQLLNLDFSMKSRIAPLLAENRRAELDSIIKMSGRDVNTRITVIDTFGVVVADSKADPKTMENHADRPELIEAKAKGIGHAERYSHTIHDDMLYTVVPIKNGDTILGYSRASLYLKDINTWIGGLRSQILQISLLIVVLGLALAYIFSRSITKPIKRLVMASRRVADGDFSAKVYVSNHDEIRELADSFNTMTDKIKDLFDQASMQQEELNSIITSMKDGFAVFDAKGKILLFNEGFIRIAGSDFVENKNYWEILRESAFIEFMEQTLKKRKGIAREATIDGHHYLCSSSYLEAKGELVLIMSDITQLKMLENIKRDFVVNVSHELRTPLTAIKGFIETLQDESDEKQQRYLEIVERHTDRLINIVNDLLLLSKLEDAGQKLEITDTNIVEIASNVVKMFEQKLIEKNLYLNINVADGFPTVQSDQYKIEHLMINLIDNSIKYTDEGGVDIDFSQTNDFAVISVTDTGIGIPKEKLGRIFERFFTVDNSRSRKVGGTGLGLAIVKHIVQLHGGEIKAESSENGSRMTVLLPLVSRTDE